MELNKKNLIKEIVKAWNNKFNIKLEKKDNTIILHYNKPGLHFYKIFEEN